MSHYVGVGDDLKKLEMSLAKTKAELARAQAAASGSSGGSSAGASDGMFGMDTTTLAIAAAAVGIIGYAVWKKRKKG
ncbi:MAG: hypothetical protein QG602_408 [Verrucomicrobiota bacterium]|nr:hypothetical protein [Verrucomicrobiota bacterium]